MSSPVYSGRAAVFGGVLEARLTDVFGFVIEIRGEPHPDGGWTLATTVIIPEGLRVPFIDDVEAGA